jgi:hypothetical protein
VFLEGTEGATVLRCSCRGSPGHLSIRVSYSKSILYGAFVWARRALNSQKRRFLVPAVTRMDGNALMLSRYNRNASVRHSEFAWIGDTALAAWGYTDELSANGTRGFDATDGDFPRHTTIANNVVREVGIWEKQSSAWFQAKSMQNTIVDNIFFNGPRAGINYNDGFGGGNNITGNILFNYCRDSGDHGPFNSWDRQMFLIEQPDDGGVPSVYPQFNTIQRNLMIANYNSQEGVDNDDGLARADGEERERREPEHDGALAAGGGGEPPPSSPVSRPRTPARLSILWGGRAA